MKHYSLGILALSAAALISCTKEEQMANSINIEVTDISYSTATIVLKATTPHNVTGYMVGFRAAEGEPMCDVLMISSRDRIFDAKPGRNEYKAEISGLKPGTKYNIRGFVMEGLSTATWSKTKSFKTKELVIKKCPECVDLGLSVKWSGWNLDASKPEEYGGYYQWAGLEDVSSTSIYLDWDNCPYHTGTSMYSDWTKYITNPSYGTVDNKTVLEPEDDVAKVKLGGKWRVPTAEEWYELIDDCSWTWTIINGVEGYMVQSRITGFTDNWIFLPTAGQRSGNRLGDAGSCGYYWSSSLHGNPDRACRFYFYSTLLDYTDYNTNYVGSSDRYEGLSVRPVCDK